MNKNSYRIIYSKARQMFVAVAENVRSQTKASGQSEASSQNPINNESQAFHQLWQVKALVASMSFWMPLAPVYADIVADGAANAENRAVIAAGRNAQGAVVPVVNIQTPKNGVSHNIYQQFDVLAEGAVLNNSRQGAATQTAGNVAANPFLATGEARIILNEVNSAAASRFEGNLEVAGQMADVIIANPSGINIQGGGFINANKAIFTTGKPQLNADGSIKQFTVDQGKITVSANSNSKFGLGGNNNDANYVDIYARALELSAELRAKNDIQVITGANDVSADLQDTTAKTGTGAAPTLAVDVKALGGMYANNIYLVGTEKGLGVSNAGTLEALNSLVVTSAGKIENTGALYNKNPQNSLLSLSSGEGSDIVHTGVMITNGNLILDSGKDIIVDRARIEKHGADNKNIVSLSAKNDINIQNSTNIQNFGEGGDLYLDANNINLGNDVNLGVNGSISLQAKQNLQGDRVRNISSMYDLNLYAGNLLSFNNTYLWANFGNLNFNTSNANSNLLLDWNGFNVWKDINIYSSGDLTLKNLGFVLDNSVTRSKNFNAYSGRNLVWDSTARALPQINGDIKVEAGNLIDLQGSGLSSTGDLKLQAKALNIGTDLNAGKNLSLNATQSDLTLNKTLSAQNNIDVTSLDGKITAIGLNATSAQGKLSILGAKDTLLTNAGTANTVLKGGQGVTIGTTGIGDLTVQNTILETQNGNIVATSGAKNTLTDSTLTAKNNIEIFATDNLLIDGIKSTSQQHTALNSKKNIYINSQANVDDSTNFSSTKNSELNSTGVLSLVSDKGLNLQNSKLTGGAILIEGDALNTAKSVDLNATGSDLLKNDAKLNNLNGDLSIQTNSNLTIDPKVHNLKAAGDIELVSKNGTLTLKGYEGTAGNGSEQVVKLDTANGGINLEGAKVDIQGSQLTAQKDIKIVSNKDDVLIDGVKNSFINRKKQEKLTEANNFKKNISDSLALLKSQQFFSDYDKMVSAYEDYTSSNYDYSLYIKHYNLYKDFISKYPVRPNPRLLIFGGDVPLFHSIISVPQRSTRFDALYSFEPKYDENYIRSLQADVDFYNTELNGSEHAETKLNSNLGNINITSAKGLSISGGNISSKLGQVNLEASGALSEQYKTATTTGENSQPTILNASIIIDGHTDFYDKGNESDQNYSMRTLVSPTIITGDKGVNIRTVGKSKDDNLVLQATGIASKNGDVKIESNKSILFDAAVEQSYDRSLTTEKKKSWGGLKKKYITTVAESNNTNAASVDISGKNIFIETKKLDPSINSPDNNIDIYSGRFTAEGGQIKINSGGNLNFYTVEESSSSNVDITKKSSFAGIKYNTSKTNATRTQVSELPATLKADYIGTKSGFDTRLVGTEFEYLKGASIEAGGKLELIAAKTSITELVKKEKNSVVWQSMQDKGSITETAQLPRFNGPVLPTINAAGGLVVQVPISEKDANKAELRDEILKLANQPGNAYLKELVNRKDVDWQQVLLTQKDWDYKSQGLTGAGAAIIIIIVTIVTMGSGTAAAAGAAGGAAASGTTVGLGASMIGAAGVTTTAAGAIVPSALGAMANAAVTSLATQASVSLINNGGDIGKTLKDLGSKDSAKNLAASVVTAGLMSQVSSALNINLNDMPRLEKLANNFVQGVGSNIISSSIQGENLSDNLDSIILSGLTSALHAEIAQGIGENFSPLLKDNPDIFDKVLHKIIHIAAGCAIGSIQKQCEAGAIGAGVGEILAETIVNDSLNNQTTINELEIKNYGKLLSGIISAYAGYDVNIAANSAETVIENNAFVSAKVKLEGAKRSCTEVGFAYGSTGCKEFLSKKYEMQPALRNALVQSKVSEFIFETLEDVTPIWGNIKAFRDAETKTDYFVAGITVFPIAKWVNSGKKAITLILKDGSEVEAIISRAGTGYSIYVPQVGKDIVEQMAKGKTVTSTTFKPGARQTINNIKGLDKSGNNWSVNLIGDGTKMNKAAQVTYVDVSPAGVKTTKIANIPYDSRGLPIFDDIAKFTTTISAHKVESTQFKYASLSLWEAIQKGQVNSSQFTSEQLKQIQAGASKIKGYTWHHNAQSGPNNMQLLPEVVHNAVKHIGEDSLKKGVIIK
ncbi:two-partner secretion domain-containing protein [Acinetobacter sp. 161(2023)]|uniref:two-partner secretion domain-containing protein n=1 Tax=Acinetobacter sp. 161(2023) TaxID=3098768 RepID=UPI0030082D2B